MGRVGGISSFSGGLYRTQQCFICLRHSILMPLVATFSHAEHRSPSLVMLNELFVVHGIPTQRPYS